MKWRRHAFVAVKVSQTVFDSVFFAYCPFRLRFLMQLSREFVAMISRAVRKSPTGFGVSKRATDTTVRSPLVGVSLGWRARFAGH